MQRNPWQKEHGMLNLQELQKEGKKHRADHAPVTRTVRVVSTEANVDNDTLLCTGSAPSTAAGKTYDLQILFHDVTFALEPNPLTPVRLEGRVRRGGPRVTLYAEQMQEDKHQVQARCSCSDYRFTWSFYNDQAGSNLGKVEPYVRKTTTRPERNPQHAPGLCKHLLEMVDVLRSRQILAPATT